MISDGATVFCIVVAKCLSDIFRVEELSHVSDSDSVGVDHQGVAVDQSAGGQLVPQPCWQAG